MSGEDLNTIPETVQITEIKMTKKGRYALFCDKEFLFSIDEETFLHWSIYRGMELSREGFLELRKTADIRKARQKALDLLSVRAHTRKELIDKLTQRYDRYTAKAAVDAVEELGYFDDIAYAKDCVEFIFLRRQMSRTAASAYLSERGISADIIDEVLREYQEGDADRIAELIAAKYQKKLTGTNGYRSVFASLARRGFSGRDIRRALAVSIGEEEFEDE